MLRRELSKMEKGEDPIGVIRDPARNKWIDLPNERKKHHNSEGLRSWIMRTHAAYSPIAEDIIRLFETKAKDPVRLVG
jgi:5,5'-dehydrodivanillate O-demethylase